jgi:hypothetical protein
MPVTSHLWLRGAGVFAWMGVYISGWLRFGGFAASAGCLAVTALSGLAWYSRVPAPPGRRGALVGMLLFAAEFALVGSLPMALESWWARLVVGIVAMALFCSGIILVSSESTIAATARARVIHTTVSK